MLDQDGRYGYGSASASESSQPATGSYRRKLGEFEITALSDGYIEIPDSFWTGIDRETLHASLRASFLPLDGKVFSPAETFVPQAQVAPL